MGEAQMEPGGSPKLGARALLPRFRIYVRRPRLPVCGCVWYVQIMTVHIM